MVGLPFSSIAVAVVILGSAPVFGVDEGFAPRLFRGREGNLRFELPRQVDPATLTYCAGVYGHGLAINQSTGRSGEWDYGLWVGQGAHRVRLLLYVPGWKVVTLETNADALLTAPLWRPVFDRLPTTPLTIQLRRPDGQPVVGETVFFFHALRSHEFFGYVDGAVALADFAHGTSDTEGRIQVQAPILEEDPYFQHWRGLRQTNGMSGFLMRPELDSQVSPDRAWLEPESVACQRKYPRPVIVVRRGP